MLDFEITKTLCLTRLFGTEPLVRMTMAMHQTAAGDVAIWLVVE